MPYLFPAIEPTIIVDQYIGGRLWRLSTHLRKRLFVVWVTIPTKSRTVRFYSKKYSKLSISLPSILSLSSPSSLSRFVCLFIAYIAIDPFTDTAEILGKSPTSIGCCDVSNFCVPYFKLSRLPDICLEIS